MFVVNKRVSRAKQSISKSVGKIRDFSRVDELKNIKKIKKKDVKKIFIFFTILIFLVTWFLLMYYVGAEKIVLFLGAKGGYTLALLMAAFGGFSSFTSTSLMTTVYTLASGGLNPFILGAVTGLGLTFGDSLFFYFGYNGREVLSERIIKKVDRFSAWLGSRYKWFLPVVVYVYAGLTPLPNDILMVSLSLANIRYKNVIIPVLLGNITLMTIVAYVAFSV
jgi:hypothetical protein